MGPDEMSNSTGPGNQTTVSQKSDVSVSVEAHQDFVTGSSEMKVTQPHKLAT